MRVLIGSPLKKERGYAIIERLQVSYPDVLFISPALTFDYISDFDDGTIDEILLWCQEQFEYSCDELWSFGNSEGCRDEKEYAESIGLPIKTKGEVL